MIGQTIAQFRILEKLGAGGMGDVYRAEDTKLHRQVALKVLPAALTDDAVAKERFLQEALAASSLDHANLCTVYEVGETEDGQMFLAMAYYVGQTLKQKIAAGPLDVEEALDLASQIAKGLARAHEAGIVHRDIKPANIMITDHGEAKIVDFGLAKLAAGARLTRPGTTLGTPAYMAPEQVRGEDIDARADLWSLGAVLYEMLTGHLPFPGGNESATIHAILNNDPKPLEREGTTLPDDLQRITKRALKKEPKQRYQTAEDLIRDLEAALRMSSQRTLTMEVAAQTRPRGRRMLLATAVAIALLAVGGYLIFRAAQPRVTPVEAPMAEGTHERAIAVLPFIVRGGPEYQYLAEGLVDLLSTKLDGAGDLRSVDRHALLGYAAQEFDGPVSQPQAQRLAAHFGAALYLLGEVVEAGGKLHISASLYEATSPQALSSATVEGEASQIFDLLDQLAGELLAEQVSGPGAGLTRTAALTTDSLPALKNYLQAESQLRAGQFSDSLDTFQRTVELDPEFALAWYRMSVAAEWAARNDLLAKAAEEALRLSDRLSEHHKQLLEARIAGRRGDVANAERLYRAILGSHPEDVEAWSQLGEILFHYGFLRGGSMVDSRGAWERVIALEPDLVGAQWHLARVAAAEGDLDELAELTARIQELNPEGERLVEIEALQAFASGDPEAQRQVISKLPAVSDNVVALTGWSTAVSLDDPLAVIPLAAALTAAARSPDARRVGHASLAYLELARGRWDSAQEQLARLDAVSPAEALEHRALLSTLDFLPTEDNERREVLAELISWDATAVPRSATPNNLFTAHDDYHPVLRLYLIAVLQAQLGDPTSLESASALEALPGTAMSRSLARDLARGARARWWYGRGDLTRALEELESVDYEGFSYQEFYASPFLCRSAERYLRAQILVELDRPAEALPLLNSFSENSFYEGAFEAPSRFHLGEAHADLGRADTASYHYQRFIELWKDCQQPLCSWVDEAERRLGG